MNIKNKIISSLIIILSITSTWLSFAENVDVNANIKSWTYNKILKVDLTSTDSSSKIFYSFDPNWTPNDLLLYTWSIIIKKSTPLVFFTFLSTENESKIKQEDYIISYPNSLILWTWALFEDSKTTNLQLINTSSENIDIWYWYIKNDSQTIVFPENTTLSPWQTYDISLVNAAWIVSLFSPDDEKKDFVEPIEKKIEVAPIDNSWNSETASPEEIKQVSIIKKPIKKTIPKTQVAIIKPVEKLAEVIPETNKTEETNTINNENTTILNNSLSNSWETPVEENIKNDNPIEKDIAAIDKELKNSNPDFNDSIKVSVWESWNNNNTWIYIFLGVLWTAAAVWVWRRVIKK